MPGHTKRPRVCPPGRCSGRCGGRRSGRGRVVDTGSTYSLSHHRTRTCNPPYPGESDVIVEEAQGVVVQLILDTLLTEMFHWVAIRAGASPSLSPLRIARRSNWDSGSVLLARGGFLRSLSNSSAIGGFLIMEGLPLRGLFNVILCRSHVA